MEDLQMRVLRGVALLNEKLPSWFLKIKPGTLNMFLVGECVLGQVFGHYSVEKNYAEGLKELGITIQEAHLYGFAAISKEDYLELNRLWVEQMTRLRQVEDW